MELATRKDYDQLSAEVREYGSNRLYELIEAMRPYVAQCLDDPDGLADVEPARILAHAAMIKLQAALIRDLAALYGAQRPPREREDATRIPAAQVQEMLAAAQVRMQEAVAVAAAAAADAVRAEVAAKRRLELAAARAAVVGKLESLRGR